MDIEFFETFIECNLLEILSDDSNILFNANKDLHSCISKIVDIFKTE